MSEEFDFPATHGDLVEIDGYEARVFQVESYRVETNFYPGEQWTEVVYDLVDVINGEYLEADAEDLTLLADAGQADEYMRTIDVANYPRGSHYIIGVDLATGNDYTVFPKPIAPAPPTAVEQRKQARKEKAEAVDELLDRRAWYMRNGGEGADDRMAEIDSELKRIVEE